MDAVINCHLPMFNADEFIMSRIIPVKAGNVADRYDTRSSEQVTIGDHTVFKSES